MSCCGGGHQHGQQQKPQQGEQGEQDRQERVGHGVECEHDPAVSQSGNNRTLMWAGGIGLVALAGYLLYQNGYTNLLLYGLILLCPLMHLFMGHGHGHGQGHRHGAPAPRNRADAEDGEVATPRAGAR